MGHNAVEAGRWWRRVGRAVETVGVEPVADRYRTGTPGRLFLVWTMTAGSATTPLLGAILYPYGFRLTLGVMIVALLLFVVPCGLFSEIGREVPVTGLVIARRTYGWPPAFVLSGLFAIVNMAYFGLNAATGAQILAALSHTDTWPWYWGVGGIDIVLVLFGFRWLEYFYRYTAALFVACYTALALYVLTHYDVRLPQQTAPMHWGAVVSVVAGFSILSWIYEASTISRFSKPAAATRRRMWYFLAPGAGIMLSNITLGLLGMISREATGNWNIAVVGAGISSWGAVAAAGASLGVLHTNAMNLYPASTDLLGSLNTVYKPRRWQQPLATVLLGVVGVLLAQVGILSHAETFSTAVGGLVGPFAFVIIVDWLWGMPDRRDIAHYFHRRRRDADRRQPWAIGCFLTGSAVSLWGPHVLPRCLTDMAPLNLLGPGIAGIAYGIVLIVTRSLSGHDGTPVGDTSCQPIRAIDEPA